MRSRSTAGGMIRQHVFSFRGSREDSRGNQAARRSDDGCKRHTRTCVALTQTRGESVVGSEGISGGRGKGVGDADGKVLVPFAAVLVAEEVEMCRVVCPGHGDVEFDAALLDWVLVRCWVARDVVWEGLTIS